MAESRLRAPLWILAFSSAFFLFFGSGCADAEARRNLGIMGKPAPEVWASAWRNLPKGDRQFSIKTQRGRVVVLFFFQSWCPGCHSRGFPTLQTVSGHYAGKRDVSFAVLQTVFEGFSSNTASRAWSSMKEFGLDLPIGHDPGPTGRRSTTMGRYRSGGTPWIVIIDKKGIVRFNGFHLSPAKAIRLIDQLRKT